MDPTSPERFSKVSRKRAVQPDASPEPSSPGKENINLNRNPRPPGRRPATTSGGRAENRSMLQNPVGVSLLNSAMGVVVTNQSGEFLILNDAFCAMTGYAADELNRRSWSHIADPTDETEMAVQRWRANPQAPAGMSIDRRCRRKDGTELWLRSSFSRLQGRGKSRCSLVLIEDITQRKQQEQLLADKERQSREAQTLAQIGNWEWDPATDAVTWSEGLYRLANRDPEASAPSFTDHAQFFADDSWNELKACVDEAVHAGTCYELELEAIRSEGARAWVVARGEPVRDGAGRIVALRGTIQDITRRKETEQALRVSQDKLIKTFQAVPVAINVVHLGTARQLEVNEMSLRMTGHTREEVVGHTALELGYWDDWRVRNNLVSRLLRGEQLRNVECQFRRKNGEQFTGLLSADTMNVDGEACAIVATMDITSLRSAEDSARKLAAKLALYFQQTMLGLIECDAQFKVREWNPAAEAIFGFTQSEAIGQDVRDLTASRETRKEPDQLFNVTLHSSRAKCSKIRNTTKDGREIICEWFNTPLQRKGERVSGVMSLVRDVTAEKRMQAELAASEATLSAIFHSAEDGIWTVDDERFALMTFNDAASKGFAKRRGFELRAGMTPDELAPPDLASWWKRAYRRALRTGGFEADYVGVDKSNVFRVSLYPLIRDGRVFGISVFAKDVTERRRAGQALEQSEQRYRHLVASSHDWVWEVDAEGRYTYAGPQCVGLLGHAPEEIIGKTPFELMPACEAERVSKALREVFADRKAFRAFEKINLHKDGRQVVLETNGVPILDEKGTFGGYVGMDRDITARKQAEEALRESERRLRLALESGQMFAFEWNPNTDVVIRSIECLSVLQDPNFPAVEKGFVNHLLSGDRERYMKSISELTPERDSYQASYRKVLSDGRVCWIEARGRGLFDANGSLTRVVGIAADVTARKDAEDALRQLSARLINAQEEERQRVARELHDGISQALAVVSVQLVRAANAAADAELNSKLQVVYDNLQAVLSDIGHLSHELHPSTLKHLGLSSAVRVLCEDTTQAHGIDVEFTDKGAPTPTTDTALCLYRVAQEALHNIVKHGNCKQAWVELGGEESEITLRIWDHGVGFQTDRTNTGLGLVSMRERVRLVAGRISITSRPKWGTLIEVHAPVRRNDETVAA